MILGGVALVLGGPGDALGESRSAGWVAREVPPSGAAVDLDAGIRLEVPSRSKGGSLGRPLKVKTGRALRGRAVHPSFEPHGPRVEVGPETRITADLTVLAADMEGREGKRRVLAVEIARDHRLGPFDPTEGIRSRRPGRQTAAWVLVPLEPRGDDRLGCRAAFVERRRLQLGWVPERLAPPAAGVPMGVGGDHVALCVGRRGAVMELTSGELIAVAPSRGDSRGTPRCEEVVLRRVRSAFTPRLPRGVLTPVGPTFAVEGLAVAALVQRGRASLSVPVRGGPREGRRLVLAVERIVNEGECSGSPSAGGCEVRWQRRGHLVVEAHLDDEGRAHARLPVGAQVGLRDGRLRFGWLATDAEGVEVIPAPRRRSRR